MTVGMRTGWHAPDISPHAFHRPRSAPEAYLINVRCLDDEALAAAAPKIVRFDGENWEESFEALER